MLLSSLALGPVGVTRKMHEDTRRGGEKERTMGGGGGVEKKKIKLAEKQMPGCALAYPLSAKETQQQIAALHC